MIGSIPEKVTLFIRPSKNVYFKWESDVARSASFDVRPCFISDYKNKKTLETGKLWATINNIEPETITVENKPFKIKIITLEIREKGGRAYKVSASLGGVDNLYFDLREDVLLDTIYNCGIQSGGLLNGEFVFARVGSQMKPIRVGSLIYHKIAASTKLNSQKPCELKIGGVYQNKYGQKYIYLGRKYSRKIKASTRYDFRKNTHIVTNLIIGESFLYHVFVLENYVKKYQRRFCNFELVKNSSFKQYVGDFDINAEELINEIVSENRQDFVQNGINSTTFNFGKLSLLSISDTQGFLFEPIKDIKVENVL